MSYELTRSQRDRIRAGGAPRLTFPGDEPCPLEPGDVVPVAANLELVVERIRRNKKGEHSIVYTIRDFRVRLPRRVPPVHTEGKGHLDQYGMPAPPNAAEIKLASIDGATTSAKRLAVKGHDLAENVEAEDYRVIKMKSRERWSEHQATEKAEQQAREDTKRIAATIRDSLLAMARNGADPTEYLVGVQRAALAAREEQEAA